MGKELEIRNRVTESGLINFDLSDLVPKGIRIGIDLKDFLYQELILKEKDFREKVNLINVQAYKDAYIYIYNSVDAIIPLWAYFLITAKLSEVSKKIVCGNRKDLETILLHNAVEDYDFSKFEGKRVLIKGCSDEIVPENAYVELVQKLRKKTKSLMFGEACSNVPIFKN